MAAYRHNDWSLLIGVFVEIRQNNKLVRSGFVEDAMPDSSAVWIAADASHYRTFIDKAEGYEVWVEPQPLEGQLAYRMTSNALQKEH